MMLVWLFFATSHVSAIAEPENFLVYDISLAQVPSHRRRHRRTPPGKNIGHAVRAARRPAPPCPAEAALPLFPATDKSAPERTQLKPRSALVSVVDVRVGAYPLFPAV